MDELDRQIAKVAQTLVTGTPPGKPPAPYVHRYMVGVIQAVHATNVDVTFPSDPTQSAITVLGIPFLLTGRTLLVNDIVLVQQLPHQRLVIAAISH